MPIDLINQEDSQFRVRGQNVRIFNYNLGNYKNLITIKKFVKDRVSMMPKRDQLRFMVNVHFDPEQVTQNNGWMLSQGIMNYDDINHLEDEFNFIMDSVVSGVEAVDDLRGNMVEILAWLAPPPSKRAGAIDEWNDCFFQAIRKAYEDESFLPREVRTPAGFKSKLGLNRRDKVSFDKILEIEELMGCSFTITGDFSYESKNVKLRHVNLKCNGEHVDVRPQASHIPKLGAPIEKENVRTICFDQEKIHLYDGTTTRLIDFKEYLELKKNRDCMFINVKEIGDLESNHSDFIQMADELLEKSGGRINYYRSNYTSKISFELLRTMTKSISEPEPLDLFEQKIVDNASRGGLHYKQKGVLKNCTDVDMNRMYPSLMTNKHFLIPAVKPTYKSFTNDEFMALKFFPIGIYQLSELSEHKWIAKPTPKNMWYTHYHLKAFRLLGMTFKIKEGETNALLYGSAGCHHGDKVFKPYIDFLDDLEKNKKVSKEYIKPLMNQIHGFMSSKNKKFHRLKKTDVLDIDDLHLESIVNYDGITIAETTDKVNIFKFPWARVSPFLTAYAQLKMIEVLVKQNPDDIVYINTDGFISKTKPNLIYSEHMGDFKIPHVGDCTIGTRTVVFH